MKKKPKLAILFLTADPSDATRLRVGQEIRDVQERLQVAKLREKFTLIQRTSVRASDITQAILDTEPHIVHFSGHGTSDGELCFEDNAGRTHSIHPEALASLFSLVARQVKCVILNACYSEIQASTIAEYIDYVIGMKQEIGDKAAIVFATGFYKALGAGRSIIDAFNFGIVELKLFGIQESLTPILITKKTLKAQTKKSSQSYNLWIESLPWTDILEDVYSYLINDQIPESGGWGISQYGVMEYASRKDMSNLEKEEGGIISTYLALRALYKYEDSPSIFRSRDYAKRALNYFIHRQTHKGGFGRFVESRSGVEIHASVRHTAYAVSSLMDLNGSPNAIYSGLVYLSENWNIRDLLDESSPALAIGGVIHAISKFTNSKSYFEMFTKDEIERLRLSDWENVKTLLVKELIELSKGSALNPFWMPYGTYKGLIFETALMTIDLVSDPLMPSSLAPTIVDILSEILAHIASDGIPYNTLSSQPDIGISSYLLSLIVRPGFVDSLGNLGFEKTLSGQSEKLAKFILDNYRNPLYRKYTHCDTISTLLTLKNNPYL